VTNIKRLAQLKGNWMISIISQACAEIEAEKGVTG
jgi:hypothetical protein